MAEQRLIDANALDTRERGNNSQRTMWWEIRKIINEAPTVEARPVVHAHWTGSDGTHCSHCERSYMDVADADSYESGDIPDFCPYCGAQMDEEVNNG